MDKYRYVFQKDGILKFEYFTLEAIEKGYAAAAITLWGEENLLSRDRYIEIDSEDGAEIYENSLVKMSDSGIIGIIKKEYGFPILVSNRFEDGYKWIDEDDNLEFIDGVAYLNCEIIGTVYEEGQNGH